MNIDWKETVMNEEQRASCYMDWSQDKNDALFEIMCKKQAQITGAIAYKAGIKEVVDKVKSRKSAVDSESGERFYMVSEAFLKELGL